MTRAAGIKKGIFPSKPIALTTAIMILIGFCLPTLFAVQESIAPAQASDPESLTAPDLQQYPAMYFVENMGQTSDEVRYYSIGNPSIAFRDDGVMFVIHDARASQSGEKIGWAAHMPQESGMARSTPARSLALMLIFENSNDVSPMGKERLAFASNFFLGNFADGWFPDVPNFAEIVYPNLYDGIDLIYRPSMNGVKYEFLVKPGADPKAISLRYEGVDAIDIGATGLIVRTSQGELRDSQPYSFQGDDVEVQCSFAIRDHGSYGFECGEWDASLSLTIDPLIYSTYLGGRDWDRGYSLTVDSDGSAYVIGSTRSSDFPTSPGAYDTSLGGSDDMFLTKFSPDGSSIVYSTFMGGRYSESGLSVDVDSDMNVYVAGVTTSNDFPVTSGAHDRDLDGISDIFAAKLNPEGNSLLFSTYLGGLENESWPTIAVDIRGNVFISGETESADFPTTVGAYSTTFGGGPNDAFVTKLNADGANLAYSTFVGGGSDDFAYSIGLDSFGNAYVTGGTYSSDLAAASPGYDKTYNGNADVFVVKVNETGAQLDYGTFIGGTDADFGLSIAVDVDQHAYITGSTESTDYPTTPDAYDRTMNSIPGYDDVFMSELDENGTALAYSTFIGGSRRDYGNSIALDDRSNAYIAGWTDSTDFPVTPGAFDTAYNGNGDLVVVKIDTLGLLNESTYLGGSQTEGDLPFLAIDDLGATYVTGITNSSDFPVTPGAFDTTLNAVRDGFVTKLGPVLPDLAIGERDINFDPPGPIMTGTLLRINATISNLGQSNATDVVVRFHDGLPSISNQIGADQVIPLIQYLGGMGLASVVWVAGQSGDHMICVAVDPDNLIAEKLERNNLACRTIRVLTSYSLFLAPGHRFISFPLVPVDAGISNVLSPIFGCFDYVRWFDILDTGDHWKSFEPGRIHNDLEELENTMGFWINVTVACNLVIIGVESNRTLVSLHHGWNMVGFPSFNMSYSIANLRADIGLPGVLVEGFDSSAAPYYLQRLPDSRFMMAGEGYWIYVPSDVDWTVQS